LNNAFNLPDVSGTLGMANPLGGADREIASWFHAHLTHTSAVLLQLLSEPGSGAWIGAVLFFTVLIFLWKGHWPWLVTLIVAVPGGMLLNEGIKLFVQRQRPFVEGPFVDWSGYSFASGHTIGATLLYGQFLLFVIPAMKSRRWRALTISIATLLVFSVGFSRIALGAHYLTDVLAAIIFGSLWLAFCMFAGRSLHRRSSTVEVPVDPLPSPAVALVPISADQNSPRDLVS
jgi:undecaprenyl-diphosphatase